MPHTNRGLPGDPATGRRLTRMIVGPWLEDGHGLSALAILRCCRAVGSTKRARSGRLPPDATSFRGCRARGGRCRPQRLRPCQRSMVAGRFHPEVCTACRSGRCGAEQAHSCADRLAKAWESHDAVRWMSAVKSTSQAGGLRYVCPPCPSPMSCTSCFLRPSSSGVEGRRLGIRQSFCRFRRRTDDQEKYSEDAVRRSDVISRSQVREGKATHPRLGSRRGAASFVETRI